jgi:hypothetical protein
MTETDKLLSRNIFLTLWIYNLLQILTHKNNN